MLIKLLPPIWQKLKRLLHLKKSLKEEKCKDLLKICYYQRFS